MSLERDPILARAFQEARSESFLSGAVWMSNKLVGRSADSDCKNWLAADDEARRRYPGTRPNERPSTTEALIELAEFIPEFGNPEQIPFISEGFLYETVGKEDARTFRALLGSLARAIGYDGLWDLEREIYMEKNNVSDG